MARNRAWFYINDGDDLDFLRTFCDARSLRNASRAAHVEPVSDMEFSGFPAEGAKASLGWPLCGLRAP